MNRARRDPFGSAQGKREDPSSSAGRGQRLRGVTDDILLVFPPLWVRPLHPYCSLPYLAGYVKAHGAFVQQLDLNVEYHHHYLRPEPLARICRELRALATDGPGAMHWADSAMVRVPRQDQILEAIAVLTGRTEGFFHLPTYRWAWEVVDGAVAQLDTYHRSGFAWARGETQSAAARRAWEDLRAFVTEALASRGGEPRIIGLSLVASTQVDHGAAVAAVARELFPRAQIVGGGAQVTCATPYLEDYLPRFSSLDWLVAYDGEEALVAIWRGADLQDIPNAIALKNGVPQRSPVTRPVDITGTPPPSYEELPLDKYLSPARVLYLQGSRGCYWARCVFCPIHRLSLRYQARSGQRVAEDMAYLQRLHEVRRFYFVDEVLSPGFLRQLASGISDLGIDVEWTGEARFEPRLDQDLLRELRGAGCRKLFFGLESGSPGVLNKMQKGISLETASRVVRACFLEDVAVGLFCIIAFPGESREDLMATVGFILGRRPILDRPGVSIDFTPFRLFRPARIAETPEQYGIRILRSATEAHPGLLLHFTEDHGPSEEDKRQIKAAVDRTLEDSFRYLLALHEPDDLVYLSELAGRSYPRLVTRKEFVAQPERLRRAPYPHARSSFHVEAAVRRDGEVRVPDTFTGCLEPATEEEVAVLPECTGDRDLTALVLRMAEKWNVPRQAAGIRCVEVLKRTMAFGRVFLLARAEQEICAGE
jgi:anaerobic magnesium-protoporphyrin IX monomethyl ester cyclase